MTIFSLDIEGAEFAVLKTLPWDKVDIQVKHTEIMNKLKFGQIAELPSFSSYFSHRAISDG